MNCRNKAEKTQNFKILYILASKTISHENFLQLA